MYGKLFESMYDGSLREDWIVMIVFQQMMILCDPDGVVDMTPEALSARTNIPLEHITHAIQELEKPDPESRSQKEEGRRIVRLSEHRDWGWVLVNHQYYRDLQDAADKREKARIRQQRCRENRQRTKNDKVMSQNVTPCHATSRTSRHTDTDTNTESACASRFAPKGFQPTREMQDWAISEGFLLAEISDETEKFKDYERPRRIKDWNSAWRNWMRKALEFRKERVGESAPVTTADYAAKLGLSQNPGEPDSQFKIRVRDAMLAQEYSGLLGRK